MPVFYLPNLAPGHQYKLLIYAMNTKGKSEPPVVFDNVQIRSTKLEESGLLDTYFFMQSLYLRILRMWTAIACYSDSKTPKLFYFLQIFPNIENMLFLMMMNQNLKIRCPECTCTLLLQV